MTAEMIYVILAQESADNPQNGDAGQNGDIDPGMCGGVIDAPANGDASQAGKLPIGDQWEIATRQALGAARLANGGNLPGYLQRLADVMDAPIIDWRAELRTLADSLLSFDYSYSRPNKRFISQGIYLPGKIPDSVGEIIYVIDISGSVSDDALKAAASEGQGILDSGAVMAITVIYTDTEVKRIERFESGDEFKLESEGGGGTNFDAVMAHIADNEPDARAVIFITDMGVYGDRWGTDPGIPVMWLDTTCQCKPGPSYGQIIPMDIAA